MASDPFADIDAQMQAQQTASAPAAMASSNQSDPFADLDPPTANQGSIGSLATAPFVGFNRGLADTLGAPGDLVTWGEKKLGLISPDAQSPIGSEAIKRGLGMIGANPDNAQPHSTAERYLQSFGQGVGAAVVPEVGVQGALLGAGAKLAPAAEEAVGALVGSGTSGAATATNALASGVGSVAGEGAQEFVPERYKPFARFFGNMAGGVGAGAGAVGVRAAVDATAPKLAEFAAPIRDPRAYAAEQLRNSLSDPGAAFGKLQAAQDFKDNINPNLALGEIVPGSKPTTGQLTGDMGALSLERKLATANPELYQENDFGTGASQQNAARSAAIQNIQPNGSPEDVSAFLNQQMRGIEAEHDAALNQATQDARAQAAGIGTGAAPEDIGSTLRDTLQTARDAAKTKERALWQAVDPDGTLALPNGGVADAASGIMGQIPQTAKPMSGEEAGIFQTAASLPEVVPFSDMTALRSRISTEMRNELMNNGQSPTYARLTQLRGAVENAINKGVENRAAWEQQQVAAGQMGSDETLESRLQAFENAFKDGRAGSNDRAASATASAGIPAPVSGISGAGSQEKGGFGSSGRSQFVASNAAQDQLSLGAQGRVSKPQDLLGFLKTNGGVQDEGGELSSMGLNRDYPGLINNRSGMSLDQAREAAAEAGYLGGDTNAAIGNTSVRDFLDAIGNHPVYSVNDYDQLANWHEQQGLASDRANFRSAQAELRQNMAASGMGNPRDRQLVNAAAQAMVEQNLPWDTALENAARQYPRRAPMYEGNSFAGVAPQKRIVADQKPSPRISYGQQLQPTIDEGAANRLRAASRATQQRANTFDTGPVGTVLKKAGNAGTYKTPDAAVPGKLFTKGPGGAQTVQAFSKAAGPDGLPILQDAAAESLRRAAFDDRTGMIDPAAFQRWQDQHQDALRALPPELSARFKKAADASDMVAQVARQRKQALDNYQTGAVAKVMGVSHPEDVTRVVGGIFGAKNGVQQMRQLAKEAAKDPNAMAGLRKAVADYILHRSTGMTESGVSNITNVKGAVFRKFLFDNAPILKAAGFSDKELNGMRAIAQDLMRGQRTLNATRLAGQSNTAQDLIETLRKHNEEPGKESLLRKIVEAAFGGGEIAGEHGAAVGVAGVLGQHVLSRFRDAGLHSSAEILRDAMLNPELALALLKEAPIRHNVGSELTLANVLGRQTMFAAQNRIRGNKTQNKENGR